jgi:hypothetical protein
VPHEDGKNEVWVRAERAQIPEAVELQGASRSSALDGRLERDVIGVDASEKGDRSFRGRLFGPADVLRAAHRSLPGLAVEALTQMEP